MPLIAVLFIAILSNVQPVHSHDTNDTNFITGETADGAKGNLMYNNTTGVRVFLPEMEMETRIIGGQEAWAHSWPWQVSLRLVNMHACGGAIISDLWVVSAAHCFLKHKSPSFWTAMAGKHDLDNPNERCQQLREVAVIISHHGYSRIKKENDVAMVKVTIPFMFTECVRPINIITGPLEVERKCTITGWGSTRENGPHTSRLQEVNVTILPPRACNTFYHGRVTRLMFCAGERTGGVDACQGDSGGPLCCFQEGRYELAGVVSWGVGCGRARKPGVYTKLQYYKDWINSQEQGYMDNEHTSKYRSTGHCGLSDTRPCSLGNASAEVVKTAKGGHRVLNVDTACPFSWPWQVSLQSRGRHYCSGTLISHDWVLASRHCHCSDELDVVVLGAHDLTFMASQTIVVVEVVSVEGGGGGFPPGFDLNLIRLSTPARFGPAVSPVCLHHEDDVPDESWSCVTTTWGSTDATPGVNPDILHQARLNIVNVTSCRAEWGEELIQNTHICANAAGSTACMGDFGRPLLCQRHGIYYLVGMATWSSKKCDPSKPAVFTRVSAFRSWITEIADV